MPGKIQTGFMDMESKEEFYYRLNLIKIIKYFKDVDSEIIKKLSYDFNEGINFDYFFLDNLENLGDIITSYPIDENDKDFLDFQEEFDDCMDSGSFSLFFYVKKEFHEDLERIMDPFFNYGGVHSKDNWLCYLACYECFQNLSAEDFIGVYEQWMKFLSFLEEKEREKGEENVKVNAV